MVLLLLAPIRAQEQHPAPAADLSPERLEQLVAPIALYPDPLLAQTLMAATYPVEVVEAARFCRRNPDLHDKALELALQDRAWDPSVKALCLVPSVLSRMDEHLDWTCDLGNAFLADEQAVMAAVQRMRRLALDAGTLTSGKEIVVEEGPERVVLIRYVDPLLWYVPLYCPTLVFGAWSYPYWLYPPLYVLPPLGCPSFSFSVAIVWPFSTWCWLSWSVYPARIVVDVDLYAALVRRVEIPARAALLTAAAVQRGDVFVHDPVHRRGVRYPAAVSPRPAFVEASARRLDRDVVRGFAPLPRPKAPSAALPGDASRPGTRPAPRPAPTVGATQRPTRTTPPSGAFSGSRTPSLDRAASERGGVVRSGGTGRSGGGKPRPAGRGTGN